jgi:four helix bundle protein
MASSNFTTWLAYQKAEALADYIYECTQTFPKTETYSLTDQIRRSSRSVCANLAESYGKRRYPKHFCAKLTDCCSENYETQAWLRFAHRYGYVDEATYKKAISTSEEVGKLLSYMQKNLSQFTSR